MNHYLRKEAKVGLPKILKISISGLTGLPKNLDITQAAFAMHSC